MLVVEMATTPTEKLRQKLGRDVDIAAKFGVTREAIRLWFRDGIPVTRALQIEQATDGYVTASEILKFAAKKKAA